MPRPWRYHEIRTIDGVRLTTCLYTGPDGVARVVPLGRARTRCPRCGAALRRRR
jgi:hypothetical protein